MRSRKNCGCEWRHMIAVAMNITTKRLIIHEAESTHKYHHLGNLKKTLVKLQVISRWPRARQRRGPVRMLLINKGVSLLVRIPAVTFPVVLGDFGCDVTRQACRENLPRTIALGSKPPLVTRIARIGLGTSLSQLQNSMPHT